MSREIKFRIWISDTTRFIYFNVLDILTDVREKDRENVQQYTGLKDKNGKEIYEGDIIHYKFDGDSYPKEAVDRILTCSYDEDEGMYSFDNSDHSYYWAEIKRHCNIIGNIFENPELLEQ
jgi:uncharacterized phage protein (TIGR01671 family)